MKRLEALVREATDLAAASSGVFGQAGGRKAFPTRVQALTGNEAEVARQMYICNACRYCEGFCAVFQTMTRRLEFGKVDVNYLANLCHNCGACYHACQYAPPHVFAVNVSQATAKVRLETYSEYAWPAPVGKLYKRNGLAVSVVLASGLTLFLVLVFTLGGSLWRKHAGGNFYAVFPHSTLASIFSAVLGFSVLALGIGGRAFWRDISDDTASAPAAAAAAKDVLTLAYLDGGHGKGCNEADDRFTLARRWYHHFTFYGFLLCFASTTVATVYHYLLGTHAPYPTLSLPVLLGIVGGVGLLVGPAGLLWLNLGRHPMQGDTRQRPMDCGFIALLLLTSATGLALLAWRETAAMPTLLASHLGVVIALFVMLPYGKFAHGIYRSAALLKFNIEKYKPNRLPSDPN